MHFFSYFRSYPLRHAFSVAFAVFIAVWATHGFSFSGEYWLVLATFLVSQTTRGTPLRQAFYFFVLMGVSLVAAFVIVRYSPTQTVTDVILMAVIIGAGMTVFYQRPLQLIVFYRIIFCVLILLLATLYSLAPFKDRFIDLVIGSIIGMVCSRFIFPVPLEQEFREGLIPLLQALNVYSQKLTNTFLHQEKDQQALWRARTALDLTLQAQQGRYPEWVYETGFNPGLRAGFRYFLVNLDRVIEIFFSMQHYVNNKPDVDLIGSLQDDIRISMQKNAELFETLKCYCGTQEILEATSDFTSDVVKLETQLKTIVPSSLELLDISPDYITLTGFVRDIKDMREILLQLVMALPHKI